jgi:hypothetical protein
MDAAFDRQLRHGQVTAAIIAKPNLIVVSVDMGARNGPEFQRTRSRVFRLVDSSASSLRSFDGEVRRFVVAAKIRDLYLRTSISERGTYTPHACHSQIETVLQLVTEMDVFFIHDASVRTWVGHNEPPLPTVPSLELGQYWETKRERALETALFVAHNALEDRFFARRG